jgi:hypothetical protein
MQPLGGALEQAAPGGIERRDLFQFRPGQRRIDAGADRPRQLPLARGQYPCPHISGRFAGGALGHLGDRHGVHFDDEVEAIAQRSGAPVVIPRRLLRQARLGSPW